MLSVLFSKRIAYRFTDVVNGRPVFLYQRKDGTEFLAHSKFDALFFKVEKTSHKMSKKPKYTLKDLDWLEVQLKEMKAYVDANPLSSLEDRTEIVMSAKGTPVIKVIATKEAQIRELRATLKDVTIMLGDLERLREEKADAAIEVRGGQEMGGMMKDNL